MDWKKDKRFKKVVTSLKLLAENADDFAGAKLLSGKDNLPPALKTEVKRIFA
jgi:hypothetical protein